eukprot:TRINITY_DN16730_c0_g1_i1.p2 TRINITY_DN16730_c0_g1~~TRINITY_DN16730_c0_g1_i1.p2  ORF type:complete len:271 (+),score=58.39 TRINITY_DN16730_c0_g1_i1:86-898(+)
MAADDGGEVTEEERQRMLNDPTVVKEWRCDRCNERIHVLLANCAKCRTPRPAELQRIATALEGTWDQQAVNGPQESWSGQKRWGKVVDPADMRPGDWICPQCGDHQYARNSICRVCNTARPVSDEVAKAREAARAAGGGPGGPGGGGGGGSGGSVAPGGLGSRFARERSSSRGRTRTWGTRSDARDRARSRSQERQVPAPPSTARRSARRREEDEDSKRRRGDDDEGSKRRRRDEEEGDDRRRRRDEDDKDRRRRADSAGSDKRRSRRQI